MIAEANGASEASIRRGGRWNNEKMEGCYLTTLPREVLRALAGFNSHGGEFFLPRAECSIPDELRTTVFPWIEEYEELFDKGELNDIAGHGFLKLLTYLREVLLQDSVLLRHAYPKHAIWTHSLFSTPEYQAFASQQQQRLQQTSDTHVISTIRAALPILTSVLESNFASSTLRLAAIEEAQQATLSLMEKLVNGKFQMVLAPSQEGSAPQQVPPSSVNATYRLARGLQTVVDVWTEYSRGLLVGPSVESLERLHGAKWRSTEAERQYFKRRKVFYDAVKYLAASEHVPPESVAQILESKRVRMHLTLDSFRKELEKRGASGLFHSE